MINGINNLSERKKVILMLSGLTVSALIVRLYVVMTAQIITPDGVNYIENAKLIVSGDLRKMVDSSFFNLYPFFIVAFQKIFHNWETAGRMVSVFFGSIAVIPFFLLARELINSRIALIASLFYIISPRLVDYSSDVLREPAFWFFSITSLYFAWKGISQGKLLFIVLASLFVGMASFIRFEGAALVLIILLWVIWLCIDRKIHTKKMLLMMFIFLISFPIIASPFLFVLKNTLGKWEFGHVGEKLPRLILEQDTGKDLELKPELFNITSHRFKAFWDMATRHKYDLYLSEILYKFAKSSHVIFFVLFLFGIIKRRALLYSKGEMPFLIWFGVFFLSIYVYMVKTCYLSTRHGLLLSIPALIWVSIGFFELKERLAHRFGGGSKTLVYVSKHTTAFLLFLIFVIVLPNALASSGMDKIELKKAGYYLKQLGYSGANILGEPSLHRVSFYADTKFIAISPDFDFTPYLERSSDTQSYYLMVDKKTINAYMPGFMENLDKRRFVKVSLPEFDNYKEYDISLYRIKTD